MTGVLNIAKITKAKLGFIMWFVTISLAFIMTHIHKIIKAKTLGTLLLLF